MRKKLSTFLGISICCLLIHSSICSQNAIIPDSYNLVYEQTFDTPQSIYDFEMTDPNAWRFGALNGDQTLELFGASEYRSRVRSPFNIALLKNLEVGDFIMEVNLAQSGREYGHRDLCLFFGFQNPYNFYYVHVASVADNNANNIFIVNDAPRTNIASKTTSGTDWGETNSLHKVRVERKLKEGTIKIYFDNSEEPIMEASDSHFAFGSLGFGSFDDTGHFDNIRIWAPDVKRQQLGIFRTANQKK